MACADAPPSPSEARLAETTPDGEPPAFVGASWRLQTLGGDVPVEGVRPVLLFTDTPAERDTYDRSYPARFVGWRIVNGDLGVGWLHAPYRRSGDSLRFSEVYDYTRMSTAGEEAQAKRLANAMEDTRTATQDGDRLVFFDAGGDTLAVFAADPPRPPSPLDDIEWVLTHIADRLAPDGARATLTFSSSRIGPGPSDGFDAFGGYTGCNSYGGGYRLDEEGGGRFRLVTDGAVFATQQGCAEPRAGVEEAMLGAFLQTAAAVRDGDRLALLDSTDTQLLAFRRHVPHPVDLDALRSGRWRFASTDHAYAEVPRGVEVAFTDSTFEATDGCYRLRGTIRIEGDALWVQSSGADQSRCAPGKRGQIHAIPITSGKLSVTSDRLTLYDENGVVSTFTR